MPGKWEYPWYAAWDLACHTIALSLLYYRENFKIEYPAGSGELMDAIGYLGGVYGGETGIRTS